MQWVEVTHKLESSPLDDSVNKQGESAFKRLSDVAGGPAFVSTDNKAGAPLFAAFSRRVGTTLIAP